jgi:hypothetical protein
MSNAPGGARKGAGRKATPIDLKELEIFCALHATDREIADRFGVSVRTIHNRRKEAEFGEVMRRGRARGCINVRNAQMKLAVAGNAAMGIWLGKNMLGQTGARSVRIAIPKIKTGADYRVAADKVLQDAARGKITSAHGKDMMNILVSHSAVTATVAVVSPAPIDFTWRIIYAKDGRPSGLESLIGPDGRHVWSVPPEGYKVGDVVEKVSELERASRATLKRPN